MGNSVTRINDSSGERLLTLSTGPTSGKGKHRLYGNVDSLDAKRFKEYLGSVLAVLWRVQRRLCQEEIVVLGLATEILE